MAAEIDLQMARVTVLPFTVQLKPPPSLKVCPHNSSMAFPEELETVYE